MKKRFFLYWVIMYRAGPAVSECVITAVPVLAYTTYAALPVCDRALPWAEHALDFLFIQCLIVERFSKFRCCQYIRGLRVNPAAGKRGDAGHADKIAS